VILNTSHEEHFRAFQNVSSRCEACLQAKEHNFELHLWFKERIINAIKCTSDEKHP
jgi:hypothetical protein